MLNALDCALQSLRRFIDASCILLLGAMVSFVVLQVVGRYIFSYPIAWVTEMSTYAQIWLVCIGAGIAVRHRALFAVDLFPQRVAEKIKKGREWLVALTAVVFVAGLAPGIKALITFGFVQKSASLGVPMWAVYVALPIGFSYFLLEILMVAIKKDDNAPEMRID